MTLRSYGDLPRQLQPLHAELLRPGHHALWLTMVDNGYGMVDTWNQII